ncbi:MAG: mevalonate kinase [Candidatus Lokiarchaeota archaeon]|nr:mevalonate kinase [Candidatus Lokiarchaeota archaeon]
MGTGKGYGKTILFGEHFVVYGLPAIASALSSYTSADLQIEDGKGWEVIDNRPATPGYKEKKYDEAMQSIKNVIEFTNIDVGCQKLKITFSGDLIAASGVGASAAQATSLARAINDTFTLMLSDEKINEAAYEGEKAYHGTPSGIDNTASTYGGLIWFEKNLNGGKNKIEMVKSGNKIPLIIANTGITASTAEVVVDVRKLKEANPLKFEKIFSDYHNLAIDAKIALLEGDMKTIGRLMTENHKLLQQITVSAEVNDKLVDLAIKNGALGAKLTGTGRGGLVIALAESEEIQRNIADIIEKEGFEVWKTMIG